MDDAERAREYQPFTRPPRMNRFATAIWQAQARRYRRKAQRSSADENRAQMREFADGIADLEQLEAEWQETLPTNPNAAIEIARAERSIHQLMAMWVTAYEAVDSSASSQEK
jgi:hypothetical protein